MTNPVLASELNYWLSWNQNCPYLCLWNILWKFTSTLISWLLKVGGKKVTFFSFGFWVELWAFLQNNASFCSLWLQTSAIFFSSFLNKNSPEQRQIELLTWLKMYSHKERQFMNCKRNEYDNIISLGWYDTEILSWWYEIEILLKATNIIMVNWNRDIVMVI